MKNKWIKKGDKVVVIAGNDLGKSGEVLAKKDDRILVQGVNVRKKHAKSRDQNTKSEIISIEKSVHISNVALCDGEGKKIKLGVKFGKDGTKDLVHTVGQDEVVYRTLKKSSSK